VKIGVFYVPWGRYNLTEAMDWKACIVRRFEGLAELHTWSPYTGRIIAL